MPNWIHNSLGLSTRLDPERHNISKILRIHFQHSGDEPPVFVLPPLRFYLLARCLMFYGLLLHLWFHRSSLSPSPYHLSVPYTLDLPVYQRCPNPLRSREWLFRWPYDDRLPENQWNIGHWQCLSRRWTRFHPNFSCYFGCLHLYADRDERAVLLMLHMQR